MAMVLTKIQVSDPWHLGHLVFCYNLSKHASIRGNIWLEYTRIIIISLRKNRKRKIKRGKKPAGNGYKKSITDVSGSD